MLKKKVVVLGASTKPSRMSNRATHMLLSMNYEVIAIGKQRGFIGSVAILTEKVVEDKIDTVTVYLKQANQNGIGTWLQKLQPRRVIFNPGAENPKLYNSLEKLDILVEEACTMVLLGTNQF